MDNKKYNNTKLAVSLIEIALSLIILFLFVGLGFSAGLETFWRNYFGNDYLILLLFVFTSGIASGIIFSPLSFYSGYYLEHKYGLSNQTIFMWIWEGIKSVAISTIIGTPIILFFYYSLRNYENNWWFPFAIVLFFFSVVLARIAPVYILPLFYKLIPIENEALKNRISQLAADAGIQVKNIFKFDMSKNTKKANAAFTGIGKSKRIILGDTLLDNYSDDEIETVIAHELGHYKKKHIIKNIFYSTVSSFITLYIVSILYSYSIFWFNLHSIQQIAALPILALWLMIIGFLQTPIGNILSRKYEFEADKYSVLTTKKASIFISTLEKLNKQNLGDQQPHPFVEWFFYSHPSIQKRIDQILLSEKELIGSGNTSQESPVLNSHL